MTDKQIIFAAIAGAGWFGASLLSVSLIEFAYEALGGHIDGGDDGLAVLALVFAVCCAATGFFLSARRVRRRFPEFEA
jgi:hypothetical protein